MLTVQDVARELKMTAKAVYALLDAREITHMRLTPRNIRISPEALEEFKRRHTVKAKA